MNPGTTLELAAVSALRIDSDHVHRRVSAIVAARPPEPEWEPWLLEATACMDLTALEGSESRETIAQLCAAARRPLSHHPARVAAVCVYREQVPFAIEAVRGTEIRVATVAGFPDGTNTLAERVREIAAARELGADEVDVVITRRHALTGAWPALFDEVRAFRQACGDAVLKVILSTGELETLTQVAQASHVALCAGADFLKTSTGKDRVNATLPAGLVMAAALRAYRERTGRAVGLKPAGGIRTAPAALDWLRLGRDELGEQWVRPALFRIGASSLLGAIEQQLEHLHLSST